MTTPPDIDTITALITEAVNTLILPRFRRLRPEDIVNKSTTAGVEDLVTVVDRDVEAWLTEALAGLDPFARVIGEEAVHAQPDLLNLIARDGPLWLLDPIDGTKNFARGDDGFGVLVSRVEAGRTQAAWMALPARGEMFVAEVGSGTFANGARVRVPSVSPAEPLCGAVLLRHIPPGLRGRVAHAIAGRLDALAESVCGAVDYSETLRGRRDFTVYYRLLPWDHVAPALILSEAGGRVEHADGRPYGVRSVDQLTVAARRPDVSDLVRRILDPST